MVVLTDPQHFVDGLTTAEIHARRLATPRVDAARSRGLKRRRDLSDRPEQQHGQAAATCGLLPRLVTLTAHRASRLADVDDTTLTDPHALFHLGLFKNLMLVLETLRRQAGSSDRCYGTQAQLVQALIKAKPAWKIDPAAATDSEALHHQRDLHATSVRRWLDLLGQLGWVRCSEIHTTAGEVVYSEYQILPAPVLDDYDQDLVARCENRLDRWALRYGLQYATGARYATPNWLGQALPLGVAAQELRGRARRIAKAAARKKTQPLAESINFKTVLAPPFGGATRKSLSANEKNDQNAHVSERTRVETSGAHSPPTAATCQAERKSSIEENEKESDPDSASFNVLGRNRSLSVSEPPGQAEVTVYGVSAGPDGYAAYIASWVATADERTPLSPREWPGFVFGGEGWDECWGWWNREVEAAQVTVDPLVAQYARHILATVERVWNLPSNRRPYTDDLELCWAVNYHGLEKTVAHFPDRIHQLAGKIHSREVQAAQVALRRWERHTAEIPAGAPAGGWAVVAWIAAACAAGKLPAWHSGGRQIQWKLLTKGLDWLSGFTKTMRAIDTKDDQDRYDQAARSAVRFLLRWREAHPGQLWPRWLLHPTTGELALRPFDTGQPLGRMGEIDLVWLPLERHGLTFRSPEVRQWQRVLKLLAGAPLDDRTDGRKDRATRVARALERPQPRSAANEQPLRDDDLPNRAELIARTGGWTGMWKNYTDDEIDQVLADVRGQQITAAMREAKRTGEGER